MAMSLTLGILESFLHCYSSSSKILHLSLSPDPVRRRMGKNFQLDTISSTYDRLNCDYARDFRKFMVVFILLIFICGKLQNNYYILCK